jgi:hypothetical protein
VAGSSAESEPGFEWPHCVAGPEQAAFFNERVPLVLDENYTRHSVQEGRIVLACQVWHSMVVQHDIFADPFEIRATSHQ